MLQDEGGFEIAVHLDLGDIVPPGPSRVGAEPLLTAAAQQIPGAFDVGGGEGLAVMPFDALAQFERQRGAVLVPGPALGQLRSNRVEIILCNVLVEQNEIVEDRHRRRHGEASRLLVDRHAGWTVAGGNAQDPTGFLRESVGTS